MAVKAPDRLLDVQELVYLTGFSRQHIARKMQDPKGWAVPGGAKLIDGEYRLPLAFYNRWVDSHDLATTAKEAAHGT